MYDMAENQLVKEGIIRGYLLFVDIKLCGGGGCES